MADKHRSEFLKPVKNTLLSGASHGFPFESFQGNSLLIPVSQGSPSVLTESVGDVSKLGNQDITNPETVLSQAVEMTTLDDQQNQDELKNPPQTVSQGYAGLFSSFFGSNNQSKQELDLGQNLRSNTDQPSVSSTRSSSPFVTIPNIQSFSPVLQVPTESSVVQSTTTHPTGFSHSTDSPFSFPTTSHNRPPDKAFDLVTLGNSHPPKEMAFQPVKPLERPPEGEVQNYFSQEIKPNSDSGSGSQPFAANLGFEPFYQPPPKATPAAAVLSKAQSAVDLPVSGSTFDSSSKNTVTFFNTFQFQTTSQSPKLHQMRSESVDSFKTTAPPLGVPPPLPTGPPFSIATPPMSSGVAARNYRRDHHKRLAYAPVPGLTSNTAVSSSYLQPCETFPTNYSSSSPALTSSNAPVRSPLSGSLSQPALNLSAVSSNLNTSSSANSVHNFFNSQSSTPSSGASQPVFNSADSFTSLPTTTPPFSAGQDTPQFPSMTFNQTTQFSSAPPSSGSSYIVSPVAVHPPIMSTKEQTGFPPGAIPPSDSVPDKPPSPSVIPPSLNNLANLGHSGIIYRPAYHHWFLKIESDSKEIWQPFSMTDSLALEQAYNSESLTPATLVPTDGGRYDVNVTNRTRTAVYWEEKPKIVRRCSWFYKGTTESRFRPYDENTASNLEEEYKKAVMTNTWNKQVDLNNGEYVLIYGPSSIVHISKTPVTPDGWEAEMDSEIKQHRPKIVKRGILDDFEIDDGESPVVDHLIFVVHGIGSVCDFKFRTIEEAVDGFRSKSLQLIKSHFRSSMEQGIVNRVEILPVSWHNQLHGDTTGVDKKLQTITLKSIPRLRHFTNDTLLDILFYTSPVYCQNIVQQVGGEVNSLFAKFKARNPTFAGGVSLVGHSLGSLILFDMLCHQKIRAPPPLENIQEVVKTKVVEHEVTTVMSPDKKKRSLSRNVSYVMGNAGTGQPFIEYPQLTFQPVAFFAMGSPIGMFVTVRGMDSLGLDFHLPTCSRFFNIFHPFDPVAYRVEALVNPELAERRPVLIPHHKGRKRMHLELREKMVKVGADLKQRLVDSVRSTWNTVYQLTMLGRADDGLEQEVDLVIEKQLERQRTESVGNCLNELEENDVNAGQLNQGRRIDYVLQEAPLESFNEYVSALTSHVIYWDSEDTMLLILKEIYSSMGISTDNQTPGNSGMQDETISPTGFQDPSCGPSTSYAQAPVYGFK